ncbi:hypothetical protein CQW23_09140 [Capsicum baccatum]|uniref:Disease resistance N-terminal domain-containing protein n=1 Tax=Capsicum baccatum TaxID=33114 RepID=A0A2G2WVY1_CAPBA|nr:hypothetical protein CQW23_09140 [Capsicum baccatum]
MSQCRQQDIDMYAPEEKQYLNPVVETWIDKLRDAVFEAEDTLDELATEALRCKLEPDSQKYSQHRSFTKVTLPIAIRCNGSYDELVASVKQNGDLDCSSTNVVISYLMHSRETVNPTIINNDARVSLYMMDVDADDFRPILKISVVDRPFEGPMNSSPSPPQCQTIDNNHPMSIEDNCVHMKDVSSDSQDAEEDCRTESQPVHSFFD